MREWFRPKPPSKPTCSLEAALPGTLHCLMGLSTPCLGFSTVFPGLQDCSKCLPRAPQTLDFADPYNTLQLFRKLPFVLSKCSWTASWQLFGPPRSPFGPDGCLLGASWTQPGASWAPFFTSWAPLGPNLCPLRLIIDLLGASWPPLRAS